MTWTPERIDTLERLCGDGLSASQIGAEIGVSRNAVIGKAVRLGLHLHGARVIPVRLAKAPTPAKPPRRPAQRREPPAAIEPRPKPARPPAATPAPARAIAAPARGHVATLPRTLPRQPRPEPPSPPPGGIGIMDLRDSTCRWPLWPHHERPCPDTAHYCGARIPVGTVYCRCHAAVARGAGSPSERRAHRAEAA